LISLALKYRPKTFEDVVGQENTIKILMNQLQNKDTRQGYLFTGSAGTGKTTVARIFANAINEGKGSPIELDAASNNGVNEVRELRENCKFKPIDSPYKVYIIDEVHMLSTGAFNALLKTLEEPPAHAVFILCTTDPQKIPATIISRTQRFGFKRIPTEQVTARLRYILDVESVGCVKCPKTEEYHATCLECEEPDIYYVELDAIEFIAKLANGGMRDAISLMDTCLSYKNRLLVNDVSEILGTANYTDCIDLLYNLNDREVNTVIEMIEDLYQEGKDLKLFVKTMTDFLLDYQKYVLFNGLQYCTIPSMYVQDLERLRDVLSNDFLQNTFKSFVKLVQTVKYESDPKMLIECELLLLCNAG